MGESSDKLEFHGGKGMSLVPLILSIIFAIYFLGLQGVMIPLLWLWEVL